jgi:hypothetical protein
MKDYLNSRWWMEGMPCKEDNGQCVLSVGGVGSKPKSSQKTLENTAKPNVNSAKERAASHPVNSPIGQHESSQNEFGLRDGLQGIPTNFMTTARCPGCDNMPIWDREKLPDGAFRYRLRCHNQNKNWDENPCVDRITPWLPSLKQAIRVWSLAIKLAK